MRLYRLLRAAGLLGLLLLLPAWLALAGLPAPTMPALLRLAGIAVPALALLLLGQALKRAQKAQDAAGPR